MFSQNSEESFILDYFKDRPTGHFIDIGAYDVFRFSNTRALFEKGWMGVLVEPAPKNYKALECHYKGIDRVVVVNAAVGTEDGMIEFYESDGDAVGTTDKSHMEKWAAAGVKYEKIEVLQVNISQFMDDFAKQCDFLSIDTESTNIQLFRAIPSWVWETIKMLCIEHDEHQGEIEQVLQPFGFKTLYTNAENIILAK